MGGVFYDVDLTGPESRPRWHGQFCTQECYDLARPCHLSRPRRAPSLDVPCPHCGAAAGSACRTLSKARRRLAQSRGECHPSRLEAA